MKKIMIVLLNAILIFTFIGFQFNISFASEGSISAPSSVLIGENFTVTVKIPSDAVGYQGEISVKFVDGTTKSSGNLTVVTGITGDYTHPGDMSYTFTATQSEGAAIITVSNLKITDKNANRVNSQTTLTGSINVTKPASSSSSGSSDSSSSSSSSGTGGSGSSSTTTSTPTTSTTTTTTTSNEPTWTTTNDTVYAAETVNVRSGWGTSYSSLGKLSKGTSIARSAKGSNGWDRVSFKGQTGYILSQYLVVQNPNASTTTNTTTDNTVANNTTADTTVAEPTWRETGDKVYATTNMNVRSGWDKSYSSVGGLQKGDSVTRIAVGSNGWDKIKYNGKTAYVLSRLLTTEVVEPDEPEEDEDENTANEVTNETNTVTNTNRVDITVNMTDNELDAYNKIIEEVGVLPAVGKSFSDYIYVIAVASAIMMVGFVGLKIREKNEE